MPAATAQKRVALVIGNSAYRHTPKLENPKNDATDIGAALTKLGFQVIEGLDLDKAAFERKIRDFAAALRGAEVAVFFYAGHGLLVSDQNYLVPVDAQLSTVSALDFEMVRLDLVHRTMEREAHTSILFFDACRDNPLARNLARAMGTRSAEIGLGLAAVRSGVGTLISFSTEPGKVALDGKGRNSPFAGALVRQLGASTDDLSAILIAVRNDVMKETDRKQVPWEHSALTGRFFFNPPAPPAARRRLRWRRPPLRCEKPPKPERRKGHHARRRAGAFVAHTELSICGRAPDRGGAENGEAQSRGRLHTRRRKPTLQRRQSGTASYHTLAATLSPPFRPRLRGRF